MYDAHQARHAEEDFAVFTLDQVDEAFDGITALKYSQSVQLASGAGHRNLFRPHQPSPQHTSNSIASLTPLPSTIFRFLSYPILSFSIPSHSTTFPLAPALVCIIKVSLSSWMFIEHLH